MCKKLAAIKSEKEVIVGILKREVSYSRIVIGQPIRGKIIERYGEDAHNWKKGELIHFICEYLRILNKEHVIRDDEIVDIDRMGIYIAKIGGSKKKYLVKEPNNGKKKFKKLEMQFEGSLFILRTSMKTIKATYLLKLAEKLINEQKL